MLEAMDGGELFDRIVAKKFYNEFEARECIRSILSALSYIHHGKIAHRDLKVRLPFDLRVALQPPCFNPPSIPPPAHDTHLTH